MRRDRSGSVVGGVCVFLSKDITSYAITETLTDSLEIVGVDIVHGGIKHRLINVYRPPHLNTNSVQYINDLVACLKRVSTVDWPVSVVGDLNCPGINWQTLEAPLDNIQDVLLDFVCDCGFVQLVTQPTHESNILDLVLTNNPLLFTKVVVEVPFGNSDHNTVNFDIDFTTENAVGLKSNSTTKVYQWRKANYSALREYLNRVDWNLFMSINLTAEAIWTSFRNVLLVAFDQFVPFYMKAAPSGRRASVKCYPAKIRRMMNRKLTVWRTLRNQPSNTRLKCRYRQLQCDCRRALKEYELDKEKRIINSENTGQFYKYVNKKLSRSSGIGSLRTNSIDSSGEPEMATDDVTKAELLNNYFASVYTADDGNTPAFARQVPDTAKLDTIEFTSTDVLNCIKKLKPKSSTGPDELPPLAVKELGLSIAEPLSRLFNAFMSVGQVPLEWRTAYVTPLYKKGLASMCANYRPVSLTCCICKIMERIVVAKMLGYLRSHDAISQQQHGFLSRRSTVTNLLDTLNDWTIALKNKQSITVAYIDYSKAFDVVSHPKLFQKLDGYGIGGSLLDWIKSLLTDRTQTTRVGSAFSSVKPVSSGVIQGSVLGPLLFLLYVNDVSHIFSSGVRCKLYADDLKLFSVFKTSDEYGSLQNDLDTLKQWSDTWQLQVSVSKCAFMNIGPLRPAALQFNIGSDVVQQVDSYKDLGVTIDSSLKYKEHISNITAKARQKTGLLFKCFVTRNVQVLTKAFTVYVRPMLEYASSVWSPCYVGLVEKLEAVQRNFTRRIPGMESKSYSERLEALNLESLELRRLKADLILVYKIIFGLVDVDTDKFFKLRQDSITRGHDFKVIPEHSVIDVRKHFICQRIAHVWNELPPSAVNFASLQAFKNSLKRCNLRKYTTY